MSKNNVIYHLTLSTTEDKTNGSIKIRQSDDETQIFKVKLIDNSKPKDFEGLTPFFCLFPRGTTGQGLTEEIIQVFDGKNGTLEYTLSANAWQYIGRNEAYFSFRKPLENGTWDEQYSTKMFIYQVEKSIYQVKFRDSNYWWTFKELMNQFKGWIDGSKNYWENFLESVKSTIESIDNGGNVLEIAEFKFSKMLNKWFPTIKDRGDFWDEQIIPTWKSPAKKYDSLSDRLDKEIGNINQYRPNEDLSQKIESLGTQTGLHVLDYGLIGDGNKKNDDVMDVLMEKAKNMINVFNAHLPIVFPVGRFRFVKPITITDQRIMIRGSGFDTYLLSDYNLLNMKVPRTPNALSSTFILTDLSIVANNFAINSTDVETSVDISIHRVWFGKAKRHINGSFVTLNLTGNIFEQATEGSIVSATKGGFRKVVISGNNFYGNSKFDINIAGDTNYLSHHSINITGNVFDQAHEDIEALKGSGMIRLTYCRDFIIKANIFNGEGYTPDNGMISLINCKDFEIDNEYNFSKGTAIFVQNSHTFRVRGILSNCDKGIHVVTSNSFDIDMTISEMNDDGVTIDNCDDWTIRGRVKTGSKDGIVVLGGRDGIIDSSVTDCNKSNSSTGSGISLKTAGGRPTKRVFIQNNKVSNNKGYNIRVETGCEDNVLTNISLGTNPKSTILDAGTRTIQKDIYSFVA